MAEKRKWFDRELSPYHLPGPIFNVSRVTWEDARELVEFLKLLCMRGKLGKLCYRVLAGRAVMPPAARLAVNLSVLLQQMKTQEVGSILHEGFTEEERQALICLERYHAPPRLKETAQGLLNVDERYRLAAALGSLFREERARAWKEMRVDDRETNSGR